MTQNEKKEAINVIKVQLEDGYIDLGCHDENEIEVVCQAMNALETIEQYKWERDVALSQLKEIGIGFGEKTDKIQKVINKQIPIKAIKTDVQPYFRKHFADKYTCPICHKEINSAWNGCPYCLQAIDFSG